MKLAAFALFFAVLTSSAFAQGVLIATIDVSGDGIADNIYNSGTSITVVRGGGKGTHVYFISSGSWSLIFGNSTGIVDMDGVAGAEIAVVNGSGWGFDDHHRPNPIDSQLPVQRRLVSGASRHRGHGWSRWSRNRGRQRVLPEHRHAAHLERCQL